MSSSSNVFFLHTGWFHVAIHCEEVPAWAAPLQKRYEHFLKPSPPPSQPLQLTVLPAHSDGPATGNKHPELLPDQVRFSPPGWEGGYDISKQTGWVRPVTPFFLEEIDYFIRVICAVQAFREGGLLVHAAGILRNHQAYLFLGRSGAGKTTISRVSGLQNVLNDDLVFVKPAPTEWQVYSSPFYNATQVIPQNHRQGPLAGMFYLVQDQKIYLQKTSPGEALAQLLANTPVISSHPHYTSDLLSRCQALLADTPNFQLHFRADDSFWEVIESNLPYPQPKGVARPDRQTTKRSP